MKNILTSCRHGLFYVLCVSLLMLISGSRLYCAFEDISVGARAAGLADAYSVVSDDVYAVYYNPAGLVHLQRPEVGTYYGRLHAGLDDGSRIGRSFLGYAHPLGNGRGVLGAGYYALALPSLYKEESISLAYAKEWGERWNMGAGLSLLRKNFGSDLYTENAVDVGAGGSLGAGDPLFAGGKSKSALGLDVGFQCKLNAHYALALTGKNLNAPNMALGGGSDKVPASIKMGVGRWSRTSFVSAQVDTWSTPNQREFRTLLGGEKWVQNYFALRAGAGFGGREFRRLTAGLSYRKEHFQVDYALVYPFKGAEEGGTHGVSFTFRFGPAPVDRWEWELRQERLKRLEMEKHQEEVKSFLNEAEAIYPSSVSSPGDGQHAREQLRQSLSDDAFKASAPSSDFLQTLKDLEESRLKYPLSPALLNQYRNSLRFYAKQVEDNISFLERKATLERILARYKNQGVDTSSVRSELKRLEQETRRAQSEFEAMVRYYEEVSRLGLSINEKTEVLEKLIRKYKLLGVDTSGLEKELLSLRVVPHDTP